MANLKIKKLSSKKQHVNWHEAAACAVQIDLRDYNHLLEFFTEYPLGKKGYYRIDLLLIKKLSYQPIPKNIANIFTTFNLFEIKGLGSSINTDCYYKTIGYACFLIEQSGKTNQYVNSDISLSFLCLHYPQKLIKHLTQKRHLIVEKSAPGVYHIINEIFLTQIIVTRELSPDDTLYLRCLTDNLYDSALVGRLADDCSCHTDQNIYIRYLDQITTANNIRKGDTAMVCEGLLNLFGTSSEEIISRTREEEAAFYQPKIDELSSQINYLQNLLIQNNIPFNLE
ncbi:MAG: hypothetical protein HDR12_11810 [Lachnospiraceae bacterium]|nr:hypothetical protein [Lachnospiraceae bacterium]